MTVPILTEELARDIKLVIPRLYNSGSVASSSAGNRRGVNPYRKRQARQYVISKSKWNLYTDRLPSDISKNDLWDGQSDDHAWRSSFPADQNESTESTALLPKNGDSRTNIYTAKEYCECNLLHQSS
jgi:hypothetical protein